MTDVVYSHFPSHHLFSWAGKPNHPPPLHILFATDDLFRVVPSQCHNLPLIRLHWKHLSCPQLSTLLYFCSASIWLHPFCLCLLSLYLIHLVPFPFSSLLLWMRVLRAYVRCWHDVQHYAEEDKLRLDGVTLFFLLFNVVLVGTHSHPHTHTHRHTHTTPQHPPPYLDCAVCLCQQTCSTVWKQIRHPKHHAGGRAGIKGDREKPTTKCFYVWLKLLGKFEILSK